MTLCEICNSGPVFAGNAMEHGMVVDLYYPCACPEWTDDDYERACGFDPSFAQWRRDIDAPFDLPAGTLA